MALDGVLLYGLSAELRAALIDGRIDKIYQPEPDEIHLSVRSRGGSYRLLLSASAGYPRIHLTAVSKQNPLTPPMFCMVLRKHLTGGRLVSIVQPGFERILEITFETLNEMGDLTEKKLIIEIMGRHSNIILTGSDNRILDSIKHVGQNISRVRQVLPGLTYVYPPSQGKTDPLDADEKNVAELLSTRTGIRPDKAIMELFTGISKTTAEEIWRMASHDVLSPVRLVDDGIIMVSNAIIQFFDRIKKHEFQPSLLMDEQGKPRDILPYPFRLYKYDMIKQYPTFSSAMDDFFRLRDMAERIQQRTASLSKIIKTNMERCEKKLALLLEETEQAKKGELYRLYGDLLMSDLYNIPSGADKVSLPDYNDPDNGNVIIPLDPAKSPLQNAQAYYKLYNKSKTVIENHSKLIKDTQDEADYLESLMESLSTAYDEADILEIREELAREGYIKGDRQSKSKNKQHVSSKPHHFVSSDGFDIYVGKNNTQNDTLTLKTAAINDLWLHTKAIHGSHVIIRTLGRPVPDSTLEEAANLAAYYSKGRGSDNVPVDYCPRKNVKKPGGARPGMVTYEQYKTIYITPSEQKVLAMKKL